MLQSKIPMKTALTKTSQRKIVSIKTTEMKMKTTPMKTAQMKIAPIIFSEIKNLNKKCSN